MKILIIGGGIGGLTTALACQRFNLDYEVLEAAPEVREVGAGIWVPPNAMQVMHRLGVAQTIQSTGKLLDRISVGGPDHKVSYTQYSDKIVAKYGFGTIAIHRAKLQSLLYKVLDKQKIYTGKKLKRFQDDGRKVTVTFEDGSQSSGDCLIGADGLRSVTRQQLLGELPLRYSGQTCWRGIVPFHLPDQLAGSMFELWGKRSGQRFAYSQISPGQVYYYATLAVPAGGKSEASEVKSFLHNNYDSYGKLVSEIIEAIDPSSVIRTDLFDLKPISTWTKGNVALLGDAAHATTPNLGQGAAQAIEDAFVVASELKNSMNDIPAAFKRYQQKRIKKAHYIVNTSWRMGQITNIGNPVGVKLRNWMIRSTPDFVMNKQLEKAYRLNF